MILETHYALNPADFDSNGVPIKQEEVMFWEWIEQRLREFYDQHGNLFHPTTIFLSGLNMKRLERSCQMDKEYFFGMMTTKGLYNDAYNSAVQQKEKRTQVVALSSNIKGHEDDPVSLYIDDELDNHTLIIMYRPEDNDNNDETNDPEPDDNLSNEFQNLRNIEFKPTFFKELKEIIKN